MKMISQEVKANLFGVPKYFIKYFMYKFLKIRVNPFLITTFNEFEEVQQVRFGQIKFIKEFCPRYATSTQIDRKIRFNDRTYDQFEKIVLINDVQIHSSEGLISKDDKIILDSHYGNPYVGNSIGKSGFISYRYHVQYLMKKILLPKKTRKLEKAFVVTSRWSSNYYHWMIDIIPKIGILDSNYENVDTIVINKLKHDFQRDSLKKFAHKFNFVESSDDEILNVAKAYTVATSNTSYQKISYLNSSLQYECEKNNFNIYVSRKNSKKRKIKNQIELDILLKKFNFITLYLENLTIEEQICIFKASKVIIAPHGAGLTNLAFANEGTHVIELLPGNKTENFLMYSEISAYKGLNYYCLIDSSKFRFLIKKNFFVNTKELDNVLSEYVFK